MVEPLEEPPEGCLAADDLLLLDFPSDLELNPPTHRRNRNLPLPSSTGGLQDQSLLDILDSTDIPAVDGLPGLAAEGGGSEEEEELEWLLNKDAFPALETSFEIPTHSRSSSGGGTGSSNSAAATAAEGARPTPVLVLAVAASSRVPVRPRSGRRRWEAEEAAASKSLTSSVEVERARSQWSSEAVEDWEERDGAAMERKGGGGGGGGGGGDRGGGGGGVGVDGTGRRRWTESRGGGGLDGEERRGLEPDECGKKIMTRGGHYFFPIRLDIRNST